MTINSDLDINRAVRRAFVKHWIDLGRVSVRASNGNVLIFGRLLRIDGHADPLNPAIVEAMMYEIKRTRGVRQLRTHLENWTNDGGRWHPKEDRALRVLDVSASSQVIDVSSEPAASDSAG